MITSSLTSSGEEYTFHLHTLEESRHDWSLKINKPGESTKRVQQLFVEDRIVRKGGFVFADSRPTKPLTLTHCTGPYQGGAAKPLATSVPAAATKTP